MMKQAHAKRKHTFKENFELFRQCEAEHSKEIHKLEQKYPWYPIAYRYVLSLCIVVLAIVFIGWGIEAKAERQADAYARAEYIQQQEEQARLEQQRQEEIFAQEQAEKAKREVDAKLLAKMLTGINNFVEKYGYSEGDLRTYCECVINRVINKQNGFPSTISEVVLQEQQWVGFSESNQVIDRYYAIAKAVVDNYYDGGSRPCSADFCWAELNRDGIWLKNEYSDSRYVRTWRYSA